MHGRVCGPGTTYQPQPRPIERLLPVQKFFPSRGYPQPQANCIRLAESECCGQPMRLPSRVMQSLAQPEKLLCSGDWIGDCVLPVDNNWRGRISNPDR